MNSTATTGATPEVLRASMVDRIVKGGHARSSAVEDAMRTVARDRFVPAATVEDAYGPKAVITKRAGDGAALSCASEPAVVAMMLDQLDVQRGQRVLEVGAGTGYNAALLAHLVGPSGQVTTIDIDEEVTAGARQSLDATGNGAVHVITRDGALGAQEHAPYDRIIVTVGAWDVPTSWWEQLAPGGRLVVPLRWRGQTRSVAFVREGDRLRSDSVRLCGFVPMLGQDGEKTGHIDQDSRVALFWDEDQDVDLNVLRDVLSLDKVAAWSGATVGGSESFDGVWLHLTSAEQETCRMAAEPSAVAAELCTPAVAVRSPALVAGDSLAYLAVRGRDQDGAERRWELGAIGHGPSAGELADRICEQIRVWDRDRTVEPVVTAYLASSPDEQFSRGHAIVKQDSVLEVSHEG
jgi:protein-L-isoaspartate(D-aspartate) O-methyltransferase